MPVAKALRLLLIIVLSLVVFLQKHSFPDVNGRLSRILSALSPMQAGNAHLPYSALENVTEFLLELGVGFAFVGRQVLLDVGGDEFFIDLLFYHHKLRCYVVIELKSGKFKPEHLGQLGFYMTAVDRQVKSEHDTPTIGLLLCKNKNKVVAEYALGDKSPPIGIAEYKLLESLPAELQTSLPSIEQIENELRDFL